MYKLIVGILIIALLSGCVINYNCTNCFIDINDNDTPTTNTKVSGLP